MDNAAKPIPAAAHRARLAISWLLFLVFVALLGFGIVVYGQGTTHLPGLAMAVIGIVGIAVLATALRLARGRAAGRGRVVYAGGSYGVAGTGGVHQHDQWFHQQMWDQRRRDDDYQQQQQQNNFYVQQQQQQQMRNTY